MAPPAEPLAMNPSSTAPPVSNAAGVGPEHATGFDRGSTTPDDCSVGEGRRTCYDCYRPLNHCYCALIPRVQNHTGITILQHPRERFHPIGTARIARLALANSELLVDHARRFSDGKEVLSLPAGAGLLYPASPSRALEDVPSAERPKHLVVLDGTWHHARYMFRDVPGLDALPRFHLGSPQASRYRLRKEPQRDFVSTIEAIVHCLRLLEPETSGLDALLRAFETMIDRQIAARDGSRLGRQLTRRRPKSLRSFPTAFAENFRNLVVCYGETPGGQLVHWTAHRLSDGATFEQLLRPSRPLDSYHLEHMGLSDGDLASGVDMSTFIRRWKNFVRSDDVLTAWNQATLLPVSRLMSREPSAAYLKAAYRNQGRHGGPLEDVVQAEGLRLPSVGCRGRAAQRLANAVALADLLGELARGRDT